MRIRTGPDFQIQCILYGKWQNPDCAVRIAVDRLLKRNDTIFLEPSQKSTQRHCFEWRVLDFTLKNAIANFKLDISPKCDLYGPF